MLRARTDRHIRKGRHLLDQMGPQARKVVDSDRATRLAAARSDSARIHADVRSELWRAAYVVRRLCAGTVDGHGYVVGHAHGYADACTRAASLGRGAQFR